MPHTHSGLGQSLVVLALLWTPLTLFSLTRLLARFPRWTAAAMPTRIALLLMMVSAIIHAALIPDHEGDPVRALLFGLDALALIGLLIAALMGIPAWRPIARLLLASAVGAYIYYVAVGWEGLDAIGLFTKLLELSAIGLLWLPDDPGRLPLRIGFQEVLRRPVRPRI